MKNFYVTAIALSLAFSSCDDTVQKSEAPAAAAAATVEASAPVAVSAEEYSKQYDANEVSADQSFKGKTLLITGRVTSISKDFTDKVYIELRGKDEFSSVWVYLKDVGISAKLQKGMTVSFTGTGNGMTAGTPMVDDGEIQGQPQTK
jgi:hypothetical protein